MSLSESASSIPTTQRCDEARRPDHLGRECRWRVDDDEVVPRAQDLEHLAQEGGPDRRRLIRPERREQRPRPGRMLCEKPVDLVPVERAARDREVVDRLVRLRPSARPTSPNCRSRSTSTADLPSSASATDQIGGRDRLAGPPLGPSTVIIAPSAEPATEPRRRASAFSSAKPSWPADCGNATSRRRPRRTPARGIRSGSPGRAPRRAGPPAGRSLPRSPRAPGRVLRAADDDQVGVGGISLPARPASASETARTGVPWERLLDRL